MAIPSTPCAANDPCCTALYDTAYHLLSQTYDAVLECYPVDCAAPLVAYVTMGAGTDGAVDAVTVAITGITASSNTRAGTLGLWRATFDVRLRESGWPTARVEGEQIVFPTPSEQAEAARHIYSHGEAMHRRLSALQTTRGLTPPGVPCANASIGQLSPLSPSGGAVGWSIPVTVDMPWN